MIAVAGIGGLPVLGLFWRLVSAVTKLQLEATSLSTSIKKTLAKHVLHIAEVKRHHGVVEGLLRAMAGAPSELARSPSGRIPTQPHTEEVSQ